MPRVKIVRDNRADTPKKIARGSKAKVKPKIEKKLSSAAVPKGKRIISGSRAKSLTPVSQQKQKGIDARGIKENKKRAPGNMNKDELTNRHKIVKQNTKKKGMVIYKYDDSEDSDHDRSDSEDDRDNNSTDDYEPDTEDEEEYRSRSHFW